jgi:hypothetical protein
VSGEQDAGAVVPIRIEVEKGVAAREAEVREGELPEEQEAEENPKPHGPNPKGGTKATHAGMRRS